MEYLGVPANKWAEAIALRISDEWDGNYPGNNDDVQILRNTLEELLKRSPELCFKLIGTSIIEENYFDELT